MNLQLLKNSLHLHFSGNLFGLCAGAFAVGSIAVALLVESGLQPVTGILGLLLGFAFMCFRYLALRNVCTGLMDCFHEEWMRKNMVPGNRIMRVDKNYHLLEEYVITCAEEPPRSLWN